VKRRERGQDAPVSIFDRIHRSPRIPDRYAQHAQEGNPQSPFCHSRDGNPLAVTSRIDPQR
jgi:hypothetical protein